MNNISTICRAARIASESMAGADTVVKNGMLSVVANALDLSAELIKAANKIDLDKAIASGKDKVFIDRLTLTDSRIKAMSDGVRAIISLNDPVGEVIEEYSVPSGLNIMRVRAPLGVIAIIYEARPNVTVDCFALTIKSGNSVILRGSKDAINSNRELYRIIAKALSENGYNSDAVQFIDDESRESTFELLQQKDNIDVVIPRGSDSLKDWVLQNSTIPVIASAGGNCHTYVEKTADLKMAEEVVFNAKVQRPSVCNATEQLIVDKDIAEAFLPACLKKLSSANVKILGDDITCKLYPAAIPSTDEDYYTEHLDYIISVKVLSDYNEAISWINEHTTRHSESIITNDEKAAREFTRRVDAAAVYVNASTRFTDGYEFGLGAEMGISTQKLHARGPIGLRELTSIKFVVTGTGQIRK